MMKNIRKDEKPMKSGRTVNGVQVITRAVDILWSIGRMGSVFSQRLPLPYNSQLLIKGIMSTSLDFRLGFLLHF
jgi:hypothetical protein